jgi:hypothetical protein
MNHARDRKWPLKKRPVIAHIKVRSKLIVQLVAWLLAFFCGQLSLGYLGLSLWKPFVFPQFLHVAWLS